MTPDFWLGFAAGLPSLPALALLAAGACALDARRARRRWRRDRAALDALLTMTPAPPVLLRGPWDYGPRDDPAA